jgi:predicted CXXCH cytochrome family protein
LILPAPAEVSAACNVCHSKNPKMVKMHEALQFKDCFKCHGSGQVKKGEEQKTQMVNDPLCAGCHKK